MRSSWAYLRAAISLGLSLSLIAVFSVRSFAATVPDDPKLEIAVADTPVMTGQLTLKKGKVTINGNEMQTGATVLTGSLLQTDSDSVAVIDLGEAGRVELRGGTTVLLTFAPGWIHIKSSCDRTRLEVTRGELGVEIPEIKAILAGKDETYDGSAEATTHGSTDFIVDCKGKRGAYIWAGWWGLAALVGLGTTLAVGVVIGGKGGRPRVSPSI